MVSAVPASTSAARRSISSSQAVAASASLSSSKLRISSSASFARCSAGSRRISLNTSVAATPDHSRQPASASRRSAVPAGSKSGPSAAAARPPARGPRPTARPVLATFARPAANMRKSGRTRARSSTSLCAPTWDALVECLSNPVLGPGARGSAVVAADPAEVGEGDRRRRRGRDPLPAGAGHRERCAPPPRQRPSTPQQAPDAPPHGSDQAARRRGPAVVVAAGDRSRPAGDRSALASCRLPPVSGGADRGRGKASPLPSETIDLIRDMAARGRLWGADRIRGELLKLGIKEDPEVHSRCPRSRRRRRAELGDLLEEPCRTHVGLRLHPDARPLVLTGLRVLLRAPSVGACRARRRDAPPYPGVDGPAVAQRHDGW